MKSRFDTHCHLFVSKDMLKLRFIMQILMNIPNIFDEDDYSKFNKNNNQQWFNVLNKKIRSLHRIIHFIQTGFAESSSFLYSEIETDYTDEYALVPLMFDLECCFVGKREGDFNKQEMINHIYNRLENAKTVLHDNKTKLNDTISQNQTTTLSPYKQKKFTELNNSVDTLESLLDDVKNNQLQGNLFDEPEISDFYFQLKGIVELKNAHKTDVFPFMAIDPRRKGIIQEFIDEIYPQRLFTGVKLYTPNGYSPTDDELMKEGGLYDFCQKNNVPITVHNSMSGFATPLHEVEIDGDYFDGNSIVPIHADLHFSEAFTDAWVTDRAKKLNHPFLWKKVLDAYPNLRLNLAHFGSGILVNGKKDFSWSEIIYTMIESGNYPNLYTDLSCWTDYKELDYVYNTYIKNADVQVKSKFLYGSDFYLNLIFIDDLKQYEMNFKLIFSSADFDLISIDNPKKFLF